MKTFISISFSIFVLFFADLSICEEVSKTADASDKTIEDVVVDFLKLRNPFLPQLPKEEIIKTPVEHPIQTIDNTKVVQALPPPVLHQEPKLDEKPVELPKITLQGIIFDVKDPQVIIDDQSYGLGDSVMGATIKSIGKSGVQLLFSGKEFKVDLEN